MSVQDDWDRRCEDCGRTFYVLARLPDEDFCTCGCTESGCEGARIEGRLCMLHVPLMTPAPSRTFARRVLSFVDGLPREVAFLMLARAFVVGLAAGSGVSLFGPPGAALSAVAACELAGYAMLKFLEASASEGS